MKTDSTVQTPKAPAAPRKPPMFARSAKGVVTVTMSELDAAVLEGEILALNRPETSQLAAFARALKGRR